MSRPFFHSPPRGTGWPCAAKIKKGKKMKKIRITNRKDCHAVINAIGDNEALIKRAQSENKKLKALFEEWAKEHPEEAFKGGGPFMEDETDKYAYRMEKGEPALRVQSHLTVDDVVRKLGAEPEMEQYVLKTYDSDEIKAEFGGNEKKRKAIEEFGLFFTKPEPHLKVEAK